MRASRIHQIAVPVDDLDAAVDFYRDVLGATFMTKFDPPGLAFFDLAGVRLLLDGAADRSALYLWVDDIEAAARDLEAAGVTLDHQPQLVHRDEDGTFGPAGAEEWMAFCTDPSGNVVALATRKGPAA